MSGLVDLLVGLLAAIPGAVADLDDADRARILASLDATKAALSAITPNAPAVRAAIERRRLELAETERAARGDEPTRETTVPR